MFTINYHKRSGENFPPGPSCFEFLYQTLWNFGTLWIFNFPIWDLQPVLLCSGEFNLAWEGHMITSFGARLRQQFLQFLLVYRPWASHTECECGSEPCMKVRRRDAGSATWIMNCVQALGFQFNPQARGLGNLLRSSRIAAERGQWNLHLLIYQTPVHAALPLLILICILFPVNKP